MAESHPTLQQVRSQLWFHLNTDVASAAGMSLADLQQVIAGRYKPDENQLTTLARIMELLDG